MPGRFRPDVADRTWAKMLTFLEGLRDRDAAISIEWTFRAHIARDYDFGANVRHE
jgi:hypothetical protein